MTRVAACILAGGFGTRVRHVLGELPKPLAPVLGYPFLYWVLRYLEGQGVADIVLSTYFEAAQVEAFAATAKARLGGYLLCVREPEPLGTAGGFAYAVEGAHQHGLRPDIWLCFNGDSLVLTPLKPLIEQTSSDEVHAGLIAVPVDDAGRFGTVEADQDGWLCSFHEKRPGKGLINAGVYAFKAAVMQDFPAIRPISLEYEIFPRLVSIGRRVRVVPLSAPFIDIGTESTLHEAESFVRSHQEWFASANLGDYSC